MTLVSEESAIKDVTKMAAKHHEIIILGAGPGGLQLGYFLERAKLDYAILDRASVAGSFFSQHPVHRTLLSINKIHTGFSDVEKNLRWDWNSLLSEDGQPEFKQYDQQYFPSADSLVRYLRAFSEKWALRILFNHDVASISKRGQLFMLRTKDRGTFSCRILVVATGMPVPFAPNIKGIELAEQYASHNQSIESYANKDVLILGKGNSAFETAATLSRHAARVHLISPNRLRFAWQTHFPGHLRQVNSPFMETYLLKQQNAVLDGTVTTIERVDGKFAVDITWVNDHQVRHFYDRVILCTGFMIDKTTFHDTVSPQLVHDNRLPALTYRWESANVENLFFCGTLMQANDYKKSASAFVHGMRYACRTLSSFIECQLRALEYPCVSIPFDQETIFMQLYDRLRYASSLWHMHGSLCDAYILEENRTHFKLLKDVPVAMLSRDPKFNLSSRIEFHFTFENPQDLAERSKFTPGGAIHPALFFYVEGKLLRECHMYEDVYAEWERERFGFCFEEPLSEYLDGLAHTGRAIS